MSEEQPITIEWIEDQLARVRARTTEGKHDFTEGDLLWARQGLVGQESGQVVFEAKPTQSEPLKTR